MYANTQGAGSNVGAPDVCLVPPGIPTPFTNTAFCNTGVAFVPHIFTVNGCAHNQGTTLAASIGDAPGVMGGVSSGTILGMANYVTCCNGVLTGGMPTARLTSVTQQNTMNVVGATVVPSQTKVLLLRP